MFLICACSLAMAILGVEPRHSKEKIKPCKTPEPELQNCECAQMPCTSSDLNQRVSELELKIQDVYAETALGNATAKTAGARHQIDGYGLFLFADALYWKIFEGGAEYSVTNVNQFGTNASNEPPEISETRKVNFQWHWGYRVGAAYYLPCDDWDLDLKFTRYQTSAQDLFAAEKGQSSGVLIGPAIIGIFVQTSELHWNLKFSNLDLELGRNFFLNPNLSVRPHIGLKGARITQHANAFFTQTSELIPLSQQLKALVSTKNNFWGIGPSVGIDTQWFFNKHWSFFGQFLAELLYGKFDVNYKLNNLGIPFFDIQANTQYIVPAMQTALGLGWETDFQDNRCHLAIHFGYELQVWWKQNQQLSFDSFVNCVHYSEDLSLHGATLDARIDF